MVRLHWPERLRAAFDALLAIDDALADAALKTREPQLAAIKLAWWREQLQALDVMPSPAEPRLEMAKRELLPRGIGGAELSELEDGWLALLQSTADPAMVGARGEILFALAARLLDVRAEETAALGRTWALADLARRTRDERWLGPEPQIPAVARPLRPLSALTALAVRDLRRGFPLENEAVPGRAWTLLRHRLSGRL